MEVKFDKKQLLTAKVFAGRRDLLRAVLVEGQRYTVAEAEALLKKCLKGKVM